MKCSVCGEKITVCDYCSEEFEKGDVVWCVQHDFDKHACIQCSDAEGKVE